MDGRILTSNGNALVSGLPDTEWELIRPALHSTVLIAGSVLYRSREPITHVYFPQSGYVSLMIEMSDGFQTEAAQVGSEGMVGVPVLLGGTVDVASAVVQIPTIGLRMSADELARRINHAPILQARLSRYADVCRAQSMQLAACNGHHSLVARLARCLLGIHDRARENGFRITHETLATLLCAHRPSVSVAAKQLQRAGLIRCSAGTVVVIDRFGLEQASCECYEALRIAPR